MVLLNRCDLPTRVHHIEIDRSLPSQKGQNAILRTIELVLFAALGMEQAAWIAGLRQKEGNGHWEYVVSYSR